MKKIFSLLTVAAVLLLSSCEKRDYPAGLEEMEHHYYAIFVPNNNSKEVAQRDQPQLLKLPVQFYSNFTRGYDAVAKYVITTAAYQPNAAVRGVDFDIVDKNGNIIPSTDTTYTMVFPQARKVVDTIYVKLLNNPAPGIRTMEIRMIENQTSEFYVDIFSTACRRPVEIK